MTKKLVRYTFMRAPLIYMTSIKLYKKFEMNEKFESDEAWKLPEDLYSCWNARGLYSSIQFVLRLRPDLHRVMASAPAGLIVKNEITPEQISAFSTYLHENIHWWQHVGSTTGFILSLIYPAQSHINNKYLKKILIDFGPTKSIRRYNLANARPAESETEVDRNINTALNNWHDIEFYRHLITDPRNFKNKVGDKYFECIGHSYVMAISSILWLISSTIDQDQKIFPDPRKWESQLKQLKQKKIKGFFYGSSITLPPIGAREIFEGQARFSELQYLHYSSNGEKNWESFDRAGMFNGIYIDAFKLFLSITKLKQPEKLNESAVGLFLLVCDFSINPMEYFLEELPKMDALIECHDPGIRFLILCSVISENLEEFSSCITEYSKEEFFKISDRLSELTGFSSPRKLLDLVSSWPSSHKEILQLMEEDKTFNFLPGNLPVRVFLARFIKMQIDKRSTPEFFCWPGVWMTTAKKNGISPDFALSLFEEHRALFLDKEDGDVYPRTFLDRDENSVLNTFNNFYSWVATYDLTRQWLVGDGDFNQDFSWLTSKYSGEELKTWSSGKFAEIFGVKPEQFTIFPIQK